MLCVQCGSWGSVASEGVTISKNPPRLPAHRSGHGPTTCRAYVWPRPRGSCWCTKVGAHLCTPLLVHRQSEPRATAARSRAKEGSRREAEAQDGQGNAKTRNTKEQRDKAGSPGKTLAGATCPMPAERAALEPRVPTPSTTLEPRHGRHLRGGMQIFVKIISTQDQMRTRRR